MPATTSREDSENGVGRTGAEVVQHDHPWCTVWQRAVMTLSTYPAPPVDRKILLRELHVVKDPLQSKG